MSFNAFNFPQTAANVGYKKKPENDLTVIRQILVCPASYSIATKTLAETQATWTTAIKTTKANRVYPFPLAVSVTPAKKEDVYQARPQAGDKFIREQPQQLDFMFDVNKSIALKMRAFNGRSMSCYFADENNNLIGWSSDGTLFNAFDVLEFRVGSQNFSDGSNAVETPVKVVLRDPSQWNDYGAVCQPTWDLHLLEGLYDVNLVATLPLGTGVTAGVYIDGIATTDTEGQVTGLVKADFSIKKHATPFTVKTISSSTDNGDGTYTLLATLAADTYDLDIVAPSAISLTAFGIEEVATVQFIVAP